jgi:Rad3-related DNA helicase
MNKNTDEEGYRNWLTQIDQFISKGRIDRKGIIHTVSYKRAQMVMEKSEFRKYMLSHNSRNTRAMVEAFRKSSAPCIMVSPCLDTGYDFPNSQARWQIIGKLPWPDTRSIVMQARKKMDEDYMAHLTMQTLQQTYGRIVRGPGDWGETICLDASIAWFMRIYGHFANSWFKEAIQWRNTIPEPLNL